MGRTPCCDENKVKKAKWSQEEDSNLINYVTKYGYHNWRQLPKHAGLARCGKSCRLRWMNYLRPNLKRGNYSREEEAIIVRLHESLGNRWSAIAKHLPGRTDNDVKNYWHTHLKKQFKQNSAVQCEEKALPNPDNQYHSLKDQNKAENKLKPECIHATKEYPSASYIFESSPVSLRSASEFTGAPNYGLAADEASAGNDNINFWSESFLTENFEVSPLIDPVQFLLFDTDLQFSFGMYPLFEEYN